MTDSQTGSGGATFSPGIFNNSGSNKNDSTDWFLFIIAIAIYLSDIFYTKFDGLNVVYLYKSASGFSLISAILYKGIILNAVFWLVLLAIYLIKKPQNAEEFISLLLMLAAIFFVMSLTGINTGISLSNFGSLIHILFIVFAIRNGILVDKYDKKTANYITIFLIFLDFFLFNIISAAFPIDPTLVNRVLIPILPIAVLIYMNESKIKSLLLFGLIAFYLILLLQTYNVSANMQKRLDPGQVEGAIAQKNSAIDKFWALVTGVKTQLNESNNLISGDYYTGQVEQGQAEKLGVFIEDLKAADQNFLVNDSVEVWAKMKAYKLKDMNEAININVICYATKGQKIIFGNVTPKSNFEIDSYEEEFLTCKFPGKTLSNESGYYTVTFNATFNFNTQSYLRTYYMEKERKRTFVSQEINILSKYGITNTNPIAIFTNGPVKIGMETTSSLPIGVPIESQNNAYEFSSYIGITLDNNWKGTIKKINGLTITLPEGLAFYADGCDAFQRMKNQTNPKRISYELTAKEVNETKVLKLPKSYKCSLLLQNPQNLLGNTPLSIKTFYVSTSYLYQISESTGVSIKNG